MKRVADKFGVDIGGVIIDRANDKTDTSFFGPNYLRTTAVKGAFETLGRLSRGRFAGHIYLISTCGPQTQQRTREWLTHHDFYDRTGIPRGNVRFCLEKYQKAGICEDLEITHFVDDKLEVLGYLSEVPVPNLYLLNPRENEIERHEQFLVKVRAVSSWQDLEKKL